MFSRGHLGVFPSDTRAAIAHFSVVHVLCANRRCEDEIRCRVENVGGGPGGAIVGESMLKFPEIAIASVCVLIAHF